MVKLKNKYAEISKLKKQGDWIVASRVKQNKSYLEDAVALLDHPTKGLYLRWLDGTECSVTYEDGFSSFLKETSGDNWIYTHFVNLAHRRVKK